MVREIGPLRDYTEGVLAHARYGSLPLLAVLTLLNGVTEEIFFRGALYAAIGARHPVLISTLVYALATVATGNPMLVFAAITLGLVLGPAAAGLRRGAGADPDPRDLVGGDAVRAAAAVQLSRLQPAQPERRLGWP